MIVDEKYQRIRSLIISESPEDRRLGMGILGDLPEDELVAFKERAGKEGLRPPDELDNGRKEKVYWDDNDYMEFAELLYDYRALHPEQAFGPAIQKVMEQLPEDRRRVITGKAQWEPLVKPLVAVARKRNDIVRRYKEVEQREKEVQRRAERVPTREEIIETFTDADVHAVAPRVFQSYTVDEMIAIVGLDTILEALPLDMVASFTAGKLVQAFQSLRAPEPQPPTIKQPAAEFKQAEPQKEPEPKRKHKITICGGRSGAAIRSVVTKLGPDYAVKHDDSDDGRQATGGEHVFLWTNHAGHKIRHALESRFGKDGFYPMSGSSDQVVARIRKVCETNAKAQ